MGITPTGLSSRPGVKQEDAKYLDGFKVLAKSRRWGESGPLSISVADVKAYLSMDDEQIRFLGHVQDMDNVYLDHAAKKAAAAKK